MLRSISLWEVFSIIVLSGSSITITTTVEGDGGSLT
jgi:hypothetical protein